MDNAADIIQTALDSMGQEVELVITGPEDVILRRGTVIGVDTTASTPCVLLNNYSYPDGEVISFRTLVQLNEIASLTRV